MEINKVLHKALKITLKGTGSTISAIIAGYIVWDITINDSKKLKNIASKLTITFNVNILVWLIIIVLIGFIFLYIFKKIQKNIDENIYNSDKTQNNDCEGFKDYLMNQFNSFIYEGIKFKLNYKIENNKVLVENLEPICSNCSCDLYLSHGYQGHPDDGIDIEKLICPKCKCDEFEFGYTQYDELRERCIYVLNNELKHKEKEYEEYVKNLEKYLDF